MDLPPSQHPTRRIRRHFQAGEKWRFEVYEEPGDVVVRVDHLHASPKRSEGKWAKVAWMDASDHPEFHAHLPPDTDVRIPLAALVTKDQKIEGGLAALKQYADEGRITCCGDVFRYPAAMSVVKREMLEREVPIGETRNSHSIPATARIVQEPVPSAVMRPAAE